MEDAVAAIPVAPGLAGAYVAAFEGYDLRYESGALIIAGLNQAAAEAVFSGFDALAQHRSRAAEMVDKGAEAARIQWITPGAGQALAYEAKRRECMSWADVIAAAGTPVLSDYPWMRSRAARLNDIAEGAVVQAQMQAVADEWAAKITSWAAAGIAIENLREQAKEDISVAPDAATVQAVLDGIIWPSP